MTISIISTTRAVRRRPVRLFSLEGVGAPSPLLEGEDIETSDGEVWFHPYDGSAPWRLKEPAHGG